VETAISADGTVIAYDRAGDGPVLIVCNGAFSDRGAFAAPPNLTERFTVVTYDRRGRGDSGGVGDGGGAVDSVAAEREYEDLAAVAAATGTAAPFVFGHSSGAAIALRAAAAGLPVAGIIAYEAPFANDETPRPDGDTAEHIRALAAAGDSREAVVYWMIDVVHVPGMTREALADAPWVAALEPFVPTLPYDIAVTDGGVPTAELGKIDAPVLVLGGGDSPAWFHRSVAEQAAAIPGARLRMLEGCGHGAPPELLGSIILDFFSYSE
jgi:pimeloyl-ACP methyl ester carboxylesterase